MLLVYTHVFKTPLNRGTAAIPFCDSRESYSPLPRLSGGLFVVCFFLFCFFVLFFYAVHMRIYIILDYDKF